MTGKIADWVSTGTRETGPNVFTAVVSLLRDAIAIAIKAAIVKATADAIANKDRRTRRVNESDRTFSIRDRYLPAENGSIPRDAARHERTSTTTCGPIAKQQADLDGRPGQPGE